MTPVIELVRLESNTQYGTFGILKINKRVFCVTLEPPDQDNKENISCIPSGQYQCIRHTSPTFKETFLVTDVPDRSNILFHAGNTIENTKGCIILAQYYDKLKGNRAVLNSGNTFKSFMHLMKNYPGFHLTIQEQL